MTPCRLVKGCTDIFTLYSVVLYVLNKLEYLKVTTQLPLNTMSSLEISYWSKSYYFRVNNTCVLQACNQTLLEGVSKPGMVTQMNSKWDL